MPVREAPKRMFTEARVGVIIEPPSMSGRPAILCRNETHEQLWLRSTREPGIEYWAEDALAAANHGVRTLVLGDPAPGSKGRVRLPMRLIESPHPLRAQDFGLLAWGVEQAEEVEADPEDFTLDWEV